MLEASQDLSMVSFLSTRRPPQNTKSLPWPHHTRSALIHGFDGDDVIDGWDGNDDIRGGDGDDHLFPGGSDDHTFRAWNAVEGDAGDDVLYDSPAAGYYEGDVGDDVIMGGPNFDLGRAAGLTGAATAMRPPLPGRRRAR
jgi:hypothetical protein